MNEPKIIPIKIGGITLIGVNTRNGFPLKGGNCFDLIDIDGSYHKVANFSYENLKEWQKRTGQVDIKVRCIPKSNTIWGICDERIPNEWYNKEYCTVCVPLRLLPLEQRKKEMSGCTFKKICKEDGGYYLMSSTKIIPKIKKLQTNWTSEEDQKIDAYYSINVESTLVKTINEQIKNKILPILYNKKLINPEYYCKINIVSGSNESKND